MDKLLLLQLIINGKNLIWLTLDVPYLNFHWAHSYDYMNVIYMIELQSSRFFKNSFPSSPESWGPRFSKKKKRKDGIHVLTVQQLKFYYIESAPKKITKCSEGFTGTPPKKTKRKVKLISSMTQVSFPFHIFVKLFEEEDVFDEKFCVFDLPLYF